MSSSLYHPFCLSISSLLFLLLTFSSHVLSAPRTFTPATKSDAARMLNRGRRDRQSTEFLVAHNTARGASGASNLKWDQGLARFASRWANIRQSDCKMTHSGGPYGENIFWYQRNENWSPRRVVAKWMDESANYDRMTNSCKAGQMCGHYTQIIWRATTAVGCALTKCNNDRGFIVICAYSPSGNYEGESPFDLPK